MKRFINEVSNLYFNNYFEYKDFKISDAYFSYKETEMGLFEIIFETEIGSACFYVTRNYEIKFYNFICSFYLNERYFYDEIDSFPQKPSPTKYFGLSKK